VEEPTSIRTYANQFEAEAARNSLNAAGIEASLTSDQTGVPVPGSFATGGIRLFVAKVDVERAIQLLRAEAASQRHDDEPVERLADDFWRRRVLPGLILSAGALVAVIFQDVPDGSRIVIVVVAVIMAILMRRHA
jgi:hypothetical protein